MNKRILRSLMRAGTRLFLSSFCLVLILPSFACARQGSTDQPKEAQASTAAQPGTDSAVALPDSLPAPKIDSARAMQYTREVVAFGARPIGSESHKKLEQYIYSHLKGIEVQDDFFMADTPAGKFPVRNIIAKFPGTK